MDQEIKYHQFDTHKYGVHAIVYNLVSPNTEVLDIGCSTGYIANKLKEKNCKTWGIDINKKALQIAKNHCHRVFHLDINNLKGLKINKKFDYVLLLDVIEHLTKPEDCLDSIQKFLKATGKVIISVPNIAHISVRLKLLYGNFKYQKMGILDETHMRFFTKKSFIRILKDHNLMIERMDYSADFGQIPFTGILLDLIDPDLQKVFTNIFNTLFAVQFIAVCKNYPKSKKRIGENEAKFDEKRM